FNMVARYGRESKASLGGIGERILRHFGRIVGDRQPAPSLLMLQAPTFHSHAFALNLQFENAVDLAALSTALSGEHVALIGPAEESPNNVNAAGRSDIVAALIADATDPGGAWLWAAADNLRVAAATAVECAEGMAAARPRGQIQ